MKNQTIILAAGISARMKSYEPRCLIQIGEKTIIDNQVSIVSKLFGKDITIVGGYKFSKIQKKFDKEKICVIENKNFLDNGTAYGVKIALKFSSAGLLIIHGDLLFNYDALNVNKKKSFLIVDNKQRIADKEVGIVSDNNIATNLSYGLKQKWCQIAYFTGVELQFLKEIIHYNTDKLFIFEIINKVINMGGIFHCYEPENMRIVEIDSIKDLKNEEIKNIDC